MPKSSSSRYGDYQCPHCGHAHPIVKRVQKHFGKQLARVLSSSNFPLNEIPSQRRAFARRDGGVRRYTNGKFWPMHDAIFENQNDLGVNLLLQLAEKLKLSPKSLEAALTAGDYTSCVKSDFLGGVRSGVNGLPQRSSSTDSDMMVRLNMRTSSTVDVNRICRVRFSGPVIVRRKRITGPLKRTLQNHPLIPAKTSYPSPSSPSSKNS